MFNIIIIFNIVIIIIIVRSYGASTLMKDDPEISLLRGKCYCVTEQLVSNETSPQYYCNYRRISFIYINILK